MRYDIIIVGGGMVGASLACALRDTPLNIALVDAMPVNTTDDPRLIALNYSSFRLFDNLDLWPLLAPHAAPIQQVHVSDRGRMGMLRIKSQDLQLPVLGYVVPAKNINAALNTALSERISIFRPATLKKLSQQDTHAELVIETIDGDIELEGNLIIGADGSHSTVRDLLGISTKTVDYQQSAIVTITELSRSHQNIAYERFHNTGALAMLPLTENRCATIWTDENSIVKNLMQMDDDAFLAALQTQFGYRLGRLQKIAKRHTYPLQLLKSTKKSDRHVLLIGNAAHTLHPVAAQGLNLALSEIAMLAESLSEQSNLQKFFDWQSQQESASTQLSHQLPALFTKKFFLASFARQLAMIGLDICPPIKRRFANKAIGRIGNLPQLLLDKDL
jgi:2-octaprenyl-6-methoxyphenol hydroxylase